MDPMNNSSKPVDRRKTPPKLHWSALLVAVAGLALVLVVSRRGDGVAAETAYATGRSVGQWMGALIVGAIFGLVAFWLSKRSSRVLNIVFTCVFVVVLLNSIVVSPRRGLASRDRAAVSSLSAEIDSARDRMQAAADSDDDATARAEAASMARKMRDASGSMSGDNAAVTRVGAEVVEYLTSIAEPHNRAIKAFVEAGGISAEGLTPASADARLKLLSEVTRQHKHLRSLLADLPRWVEDRMKAHGLSDAKARSNVQSFLKGAKLSSITAMHEQTAILIEQFGLILQHLRVTHGRWRLDHDSDSVIFDEDADADRYNRLVETMNAAAEKEAQLQQAIRSR